MTKPVHDARIPFNGTFALLKTPADLYVEELKEKGQASQERITSTCWRVYRELATIVDAHNLIFNQ